MSEMTTKSLQEFAAGTNHMGRVYDYTAEGADVQSVAQPGRFNELPIDTSMVELASRRNMTVSALLEELDPSSEYSDALGEVSAFERQLIRFGLLEHPRSHVGPTSHKRLEFVMKNTPASAVLFPEKIRAALFWDPIIDTEFDPGTLLAATVSQSEDMTKAVMVDDSQLAHRRAFELSEGATVPVSTLRHSAYAGSVKKHGAGLAWSREFARKTSVNLFDQAVARLAMRERRAYFDEILSTIVNGDAVYGMGTGATTATAVSYDSVGVTAAGELSFLALSKFLYSMRPYAPTIAVCNVNTNYAFVNAVPPANVTDNAILQVLSQHLYPKMPNPINPAFLGQTPPLLVVPSTALSDNLIVFLSVPNGLNRIVIKGGEVDETDYAPQTQMYKRFFTIEDGLFPLPSYYDAVKILRLELV